MRRTDPGPTKGARHVVPLAMRQNLAGNATRWAMRQGLVSLLLTVLGMLAFTVAAFTLATALGFTVIGASCWFLEYLTREDPR